MDQAMPGLELLEGRIAVITGAASGIGRELSIACAEAGMKVVLADIASEGLDEIARDLSADKRHGMIMTCDVSSAQEVDELADVTFSHYGAVHLLVNNAGVAGASGPSWVISQVDWAWTLGADLWGPVHGVRSFVPRMIDSGEDGWVVNVASLSGLLPVPMAAPYGIAKAGVIALSEALSLELKQAGANIGVTVACPAGVATSIADSLRVCGDGADEVKDRIREELAAGMSAREAARRILDAVREGRFAVFTHDGDVDLVRQRFESLMKGEVPTAVGTTAE